MSGWLGYLNPWAYGKSTAPAHDGSVVSSPDSTGRNWDIKGKAKFVFPLTAHMLENYSSSKSYIKTAFKVVGYFVASIFTALVDLFLVPYRTLSTISAKLQEGGSNLYNRLPSCSWLKRKTD